MKLVQSALDLVLPRSCVGCRGEGSWLCQNCFADIRIPSSLLCPFCREPSPAGRTCARHGAASLDGVLPAGYYHDPILRGTLHRFKYGHAEELARPLGRLLARTLEQFSTLLPENALLIPIPLHPSRLRERGFNQTELLANLIGAWAKLFVDSSVLKRAENHEPQARMKDRERRENLVDTFFVAKPQTSRGRAIILVDDVSTTGATLEIAARALKNSGARSVMGLVLAQG